MIRADQIPDEVVEAAARAMCRYEYGDELVWDVWIGAAEAAIAAMLKAWPGAKPHKVQVPDDTSDDIRYVLKTVGINFPLPTEASDE